MIDIDLGAAYDTIGEPWRRFDTTRQCVFMHDSQVYIEALQQRSPMLQVAADAWPGLKEGDALTRLRGGARYKVIAPPRHINNGQELEVELQPI